MKRSGIEYFNANIKCQMSQVFIEMSNGIIQVSKFIIMVAIKSIFSPIVPLLEDLTLPWCVHAFCRLHYETFTRSVSRV